MEKEHQPDSMATITMKPEYPPSEYSASEPPPAYRQRLSSSVQIARIAALTIIASSFILGSFILASSWVAARASCHQLEQLDAMLDKELALEGRSYGNDALMPEELPIANAHALHAAPPVVEVTSAPAPKPAALSPDSLLKADPLHHSETKVDEDKMQKIDDDKTDTANSGSDESSESDSSGEDDEDDLIRPMFKLPIQFDLDELAGAFLANSQKGRMNCVVERRNEEPMERRFPFNILGAFAPRSAQAERIAIICHGGDGERAGPMFPDPQSQVFAFPLSGPVRLPIRPAPAQERPEPRGPFGMPQRNSPFPLPMPWDSSEEQQMSGPREMRIHVQRVIAIPSPHNMPPAPESMGPFPPPPPPQQQENEQSDVLHQFVPQTAPTQDMEQPEVQKMQMEGSPIQMNLPWDLTPEDLHMIHRTAQEAVANQRREQQIDNDMQEVKTIVNTLAAAEAESEQAQAQDREQMPRAPRTLLLPQDMPVDQRPHYMQPRSVRSVDSPLHREKRVKRCSCACR
ncbi:uncharacterized protein LOC112051648 isoform X3 [Bicyclus anynana]|uniref:Uncharacterized protein LOC112051648 isoform X3 n=1 Tax=Bicyclus anynana TaxID=110368 RepID=A0ABM3LRU8_BICAN|nr:uncharacterized protein LOC112051648 isoform X3 [Bicyclus anynana]